MTAEPASVFLKIDPKYRVLENELAFAIYDIQPASQGHMLIVPKRVFPDFFECAPEEIQAIYELLVQARGLLEKLYKPDGFNVTINVGRAAGQTVTHAHVHLVPRYNNKELERAASVQGLVHL
jgi:diadenosine tetraphosphate (Ap4A) HIT family hydrolase